MDLVFLHGPAAAGKLTTARALAGRLAYPVFHNHLVVNPLAEVFGFGSASFVRLREQIWLDVFAEAAGIGRSLIFTFAPESTVQPDFPGRTRRAVESRGGRVRFIRLEVGEAEQERRLPLASRHAAGKLTDVEYLRRGRSVESVAEQPPTEFVVDTEQHTPERSADLIIDALGLEPAEPVVPFPG